MHEAKPSKTVSECKKMASEASKASPGKPLTQKIEFLKLAWSFSKRIMRGQAFSTLRADLKMVSQS